MKINKCRICKSTSLTKIFNLGKLFYTGIFPKHKNTRVPSGNLSLIHCSKCKLLQLEDNFNSDLKKQLKDVTSEVVKVAGGKNLSDDLTLVGLGA